MRPVAADGRLDVGWRAQVAAAVLGAGTVTAIPTMGGGGCDTPAGRLAVAARGAGLPVEQVATAVAVGLAESGGRPDAVNAADWDGSVDRGAWQINSVHVRFDPDRLLELDYNAAAMVDVSGSGSTWRPWVAYTSGAYQRHMVEARTVEHCAGHPSPGRADGARLTAFELVDKVTTDLVYGAASRVCASGVDCGGCREYTGDTAPARTTSPSSARRSDGLDPTFGAALDRLRADAPGPVAVVSGRRTPAEQKALYDSYLSGVGNLAAWSDGVTCASDHCQGTAADLSYASPEVERWVHANVHRYALAADVPGEPWHVSLVRP